MEAYDKDSKMTRFEKEFKVSMKLIKPDKYVASRTPMFVVLQTLNKVSPVLPKACYIVAMYPENKEKNRYQDILACK